MYSCMKRLHQFTTEEAAFVPIEVEDNEDRFLSQKLLENIDMGNLPMAESRGYMDKPGVHPCVAT